MQATPRFAAVILAAGSATRFGSAKQLAPLGGRTMLELVVIAAAAADLAPIVAVVPPGLAVPPPAVPLPNAEPERGLSRSLRLGVGALPPDVRGAVVLLGDQPTVGASHIGRLVAATGGGPLAATSAEGRLGPPVALRREAFELVEQATGDQGLAPLLATHRELVVAVELAKHPPDVDTPDDLARIGHMFDSERQ